jgi:hypothetical protein
MDDFLEQTAVRQRQGAFTLLYYLIWVLMVIFGLLALFGLINIMGVNPETGGMVFSWQSLLTALVFGGGAFFLWRGSDSCRVEYDYTFTNGNLDVSRVLNNKRRKYLTALEMKDVIRCGPASGQAFLKTLNEPGIKRHNWFVNREAKLYFFYFEKKGVKHVAVLELSDEMIAVMRSKSNYIPRTAWYEADGTQHYGYRVS